MKNVLVWVVVIVVALFSLGITKDQVLKSVVTLVASQVAGAPVRIDGFSLGILSGSLKMSGLRIYNPKGFPGGVLLDLPKIDVQLDAGALIRKRIHLVHLDIELKELDLVKNKDGKLNVDSLKVAQEGKKQGGKPSKQMPMTIDLVSLDIGKIISKDYSVSGPPRVDVYDINLHKSYKNLTSAQQLVALILTEPMKAAGIKGAEIYGVAMLAGVAVLPVAVVAVFVSKDSAQQDFGASVDAVYAAAVEAIKTQGTVRKENRAAGVVEAEVQSASVVVKIAQKAGGKTGVTVSARKYMLPKPEIAGGVLYAIEKKIK